MARPPSRTLIALCFATVYLVWGSTFFGVRVGVETIPMFLLGAVRYSIAGLVLFAFLQWRGEPLPSRKDWIHDGLVNGSLLILLANGATVWVANKIPSGYSALLWATVPFWIVLLQAIVPGFTRPGWRSIAGAVVGFCGLVVLIQPDAGVASDSTTLFECVGVVTIGAIGWALGSIRSAPPSSGLSPAPSPTMRGAMQMGVGGLLMFVPSLALGEIHAELLGGISARSWLALAFLTTLGSMVVGSAYLYLLTHVAPAKVATLSYVNPVVAVALGALFANETVTLQTVLGGLIILGAVVMTLAPTRAEPQTESALSIS